MNALSASLAVGIGGFLGANARYWLNLAVYRLTRLDSTTAIGYGTAFVNITGSLLLAMFLYYIQQRTGIADELKLLIATGFFGAYTTFSTFANEAITLWSSDWKSALLYIILTNALCLLGVILGIMLAQYIWTGQ